MATLYGMADHSKGFLYPEEWFDGVVEHAEYGRTKDGSKGAWTVKFRTTTGANAGRAGITTTLSISPVKNDGTPNPEGLGILFRHLAALGVPIPDPADPSRALNGQAPYWVMGWSNDQVATAMIGRPVYIKIKHNEYDGITNNKIADIRPPRPNAPTTWPQAQQPQAGQQAAMIDYVQQNYGPQQGQWGQPPQQGFAPAPYGQAQQNTGPGYQQQPQTPWQQPPAYGQPQNQGGPGYQPQPGYGPGGGYPAPGPAQGGPGYPQPPTTWPQAQQQQAPPVPGAPPWAQPGQPGFGGTGEFTQQGQSQQPQYGQPPQQPVPQPPWQQPQQPQQGPPQNPQGPQQGGPGQPPAPWM